MAATSGAWQDQYEDPLRWCFAGENCSHRIEGAPKVHESENELCSVRALVMHRPTHDPRLQASGRYPFSKHLAGRKRLWEIRFQMQFRQPPCNPVFFGIELGRYVPVSGLTRQVQKALVSACRNIVGECYHTNGEDRADADAELPTFVMPLWAFDQFHVAEAGAEPDLTGSLEGVGMRRSQGVKQYIEAMRVAVGNATPDKVYTFSFWGISQYLDCLRWQVVGGLIPGVKIDFNKLCGPPPVYLTMYELMDAADEQHLPSRKRRYLHVAVWSTLRPPSDSDAAMEAVADAQGAGDVSHLAVSSHDNAAMVDLLDLCDGSPVEASGSGNSAHQPLIDLLDLDSGGEASAGVAAEAGVGSAYAGPKANDVETCDLLGLF